MLVKALLSISRNFCQTRMSVNFCNFHTMNFSFFQFPQRYIRMIRTYVQVQYRVLFYQFCKVVFDMYSNQNISSIIKVEYESQNKPQFTTFHMFNFKVCAIFFFSLSHTKHHDRQPFQNHILDHSSRSALLQFTKLSSIQCLSSLSRCLK